MWVRLCVSVVLFVCVCVPLCVCARLCFCGLIFVVLCVCDVSSLGSILSCTGAGGALVVAAPRGYSSHLFSSTASALGSYTEVEPSDFTQRLLAQCAFNAGVSDVYEVIALFLALFLSFYRCI